MSAPIGNKNAEKWTRDESLNFFNEAIILSKKPDYDFIGEVAYDLDQDKGIFDYLIEKYKELIPFKNRIKCNCEVNCFRNIKKGKIKEASGIINLKSNHGWTDRQQIDQNINIPHLPDIIIK